MTRVCLQSNPDAIGTIVEELADGTVWVQWDGGETRWRIDRDRLIELPVDDLAIMPAGAKPPSIELRCLQILDNLRDAVVLEIESKMNDIRRLMKKEEKR